MAMNKTIIIFSLIFWGSMQAHAGDVSGERLDDVPEPPTLPDPLESGEAIEPEITIIRREDVIVEEYRINGQLYMAKITPAVGPPYYLIDHDGDGRLETRMDHILNDVVVPQWVLFSW